MLPLVVIPLTVAAIVSGAGGDLVVGTMLAAVVGVVAYTGLFVTLGVRVKRPLLWGLLYILVWESFIARLGESASRLAIATYTRSILSSITGFELQARRPAGRRLRDRAARRDRRRARLRLAPAHGAGRRLTRFRPGIACSLNVCRIGPNLPIPTRHTLACDRWQWNMISSDVLSAHATAALIGDTWLTTTTSSPAIRSASSSQAERTRASRASKHSPPSVANVAVGAPGCHTSFGHLGRGHALVLAVGELDPAIVDLDREPEALGRLPRPHQRTRDHGVDRADEGRDRRRLLAPDLVERRVEPALQQAAGVRRRATVPNEVEHALSEPQNALGASAV